MDFSKTFVNFAKNSYNNCVINRSHRYSSWHLCYESFNATTIEDEEKLALCLGFYLASWGMMRGSSVLLNCGIGIFEALTKVIIENKSKRIDEQYTAIYTFLETNNISPTLTLITKIMLGTYGNIPAIDTNFKKTAHTLHKITFGNGVTPERFGRTLANLQEIQGKYKEEIENIRGQYKSLTAMKILDMAFFQYSFGQT